MAWYQAEKSRWIFPQRDHSRTVVSHLKNIILRKKILYLFILTFALGCFNKPIIPQAEPFENTLISIKNNSIELFKESFSERIHNEKTDSLSWKEKLKVAEKTLKLEFGELSPNDFSYEFDVKGSTLIITHKTEEPFRMKVVMENGTWKLDEH